MERWQPLALLVATELFLYLKSPMSSNWLFTGLLITLSLWDYICMEGCLYKSVMGVYSEFDHKYSNERSYTIIIW